MDWETMEAAKKLYEEEEAARRKTGVRRFAFIREIIERFKELVDHPGTKGW